MRIFFVIAAVLTSHSTIADRADNCKIGEEWAEGRIKKTCIPGGTKAVGCLPDGKLGSNELAPGQTYLASSFQYKCNSNGEKVSFDVIACALNGKVLEIEAESVIPGKGQYKCLRAADGNVTRKFLPGCYFDGKLYNPGQIWRNGNSQVTCEGGNGAFEAKCRGCVLPDGNILSVGDFGEMNGKRFKCQANGAVKHEANLLEASQQEYYEWLQLNGGGEEETAIGESGSGVVRPKTTTLPPTQPPTQPPTLPPTQPPTQPPPKPTTTQAAPRPVETSAPTVALPPVRPVVTPGTPKPVETEAPVRPPQPQCEDFHPVCKTLCSRSCSTQTTFKPSHDAHDEAIGFALEPSPAKANRGLIASIFGFGKGRSNSKGKSGEKNRFSLSSGSSGNSNSYPSSNPFGNGNLFSNLNLGGSLSTPRPLGSFVSNNNNGGWSYSYSYNSNGGAANAGSAGLAGLAGLAGKPGFGGSAGGFSQSSNINGGSTDKPLPGNFGSFSSWSSGGSWGGANGAGSFTGKPQFIGNSVNLNAGAGGAGSFTGKPGNAGGFSSWMSGWNNGAGAAGGAGRPAAGGKPGHGKGSSSGGGSGGGSGSSSSESCEHGKGQGHGQGQGQGNGFGFGHPVNQNSAQGSFGTVGGFGGFGSFGGAGGFGGFGGSRPQFTGQCSVFSDASFELVEALCPKSCGACQKKVDLVNVATKWASSTCKSREPIGFALDTGAAAPQPAPAPAPAPAQASAAVGNFGKGKNKSKSNKSNKSHKKGRHGRRL